MKLSPKSFFLTLIATIFLFVVIMVALIVYFYLFGINKLVNSPFVISKVEKIAKDVLNMDLKIKNPYLRTSLKPYFVFKVDDLKLSKNNVTLIELKDFDTSIDFSKILNKEIKINRLLAKTLLIKADKLIENFPQFEQNKDSQEFDWKINFYKSDIKLDEFQATYFINKTLIDAWFRDIFLDIDENDTTTLGFNSEIKIVKNKRQFAQIVASTLDEIKVYPNSIKIDNLRVMVNNSKLRLDADIDKKNTKLVASSEIFYLKDVFEIINSNIVIPNGDELLKPLKNPKGNANFKIQSLNGDLSGHINVNNTRASLKDITMLPITISTGKINISKDKVDFVNLKGYYGKNKSNKIDINGDIKDYYKTFNSSITIDTLITNEFLKDYLAPLANMTLIASKPLNTRIIYKAKNNIMDILWLAKLPKGVNIGVDTQSSDILQYDRFIKGDFHIEGNNFDIKSINYYMAPELKRGSRVEPIFILNGKMDLKGNLKEMGFAFGREVPSETLNIFARQELLKKGTIKGFANVIYKNNKAYLKANMEINKTLVPSARLFIRNAILKTDDKYIYITSKGGFKRVRYDLTTKIKNVLETPIVIKNLTLNIDKLDVKKFLESMNSDNPQEQNVQAVESENDIQDDNYMFDTSLLRIEEADFNLKEGSYNELTFGNIKAKMSLDENGMLKMRSNRFDIASGHSGLKVDCDLKNLKYNIKLGVKDIDSDLMARVLFNLNKEISGRASGIMELSTDKSMKLNGNLKFIIKDGTISKIGLVEYVMKIASVFRNPIVMINPAIIMDIVSVPEGKFEKIEGTMKIDNNVVKQMNIKSYSNSLSALIKGRFDMERHDASLRIYTRFSNQKKSIFGFLRNISLNTLANKVQMRTRNDANYYASELEELPQIEADENKTQIFLTTIEGDVENNNFISSLKKIK